MLNTGGQPKRILHHNLGLGALGDGPEVVLGKRLEMEGYGDDSEVHLICRVPRRLLAARARGVEPGQ